MSDGNMQGRTVLVTGGTAGIGRQAAKVLAGRGARVVIVGRNPEKTARVTDELRAETGGAVESLLADLSKMSDVRALAAATIDRYGALDVLLNNAGAVNLTREVTADGFERTFATNHLAYFLLANLLLPALRKAPGSRVVNVASAAHVMGRVNFDDLQSERGYDGWRVYGTSKLMNVLFTREMARRLKGEGPTVNCLHPGFVASEFLSKGGIWTVLKPLGYLFAVNESKGAETSVFLASSPAVAGVTGKYFAKCREARTTGAAKDDAVAERLWVESARLTSLDGTI
ncbi:MAG: SDR family oxidoreductase [Polyangiales bacterium]